MFILLASMRRCVVFASQQRQHGSACLLTTVLSFFPDDEVVNQAEVETTVDDTGKRLETGVFNLFFNEND